MLKNIIYLQMMEIINFVEYTSLMAVKILQYLKYILNYENVQYAKSSIKVITLISPFKNNHIKKSVPVCI